MRIIVNLVFTAETQSHWQPEVKMVDLVTAIGREGRTFHAFFKNSESTR